MLKQADGSDSPWPPWVEAPRHAPGWAGENVTNLNILCCVFGACLRSKQQTDPCFRPSTLYRAGWNLVNGPEGL